MSATTYDPDDARRTQYLADIAEEQQRKARVHAASDELLEAARDLGWGSGDPFVDSIRWLIEAAERRGYETGNVSGSREYDLGSWDGKGWPSTQHLRLHYLADRDGGWKCRDCGVGLIDVCSDEDTVLDRRGRRLIKPDCTKRLPTRDHKIPRDLGGSDEPGNLDLVCRPCNSQKGAA